MVETFGIWNIAAYVAAGLVGVCVVSLIRLFSAANFRWRSSVPNEVSVNIVAAAPRKRDLSRLKRIKVVASYGYHPLATLDHDAVGDGPPEASYATPKLNDGLDAWRDNYGEIAPEDLNLSEDLCRSFNNWSWDYQQFFNEIDPTQPHCSAEHEATHEAEGRNLARRLQRERPDLTVFVREMGGDLVEISPFSGGKL